MAHSSRPIRRIPYQINPVWTKIWENRVAKRETITPIMPWVRTTVKEQSKDTAIPTAPTRYWGWITRISVQTENIFPVIKKFLYSDNEIFLRELVSNAVDATLKLQTLASMGKIQGEIGDTTIEIRLDL